MALQELERQIGQTLKLIEDSFRNDPDFILIGSMPVITRERNTPATYRFFATTHFPIPHNETTNMQKRVGDSLGIPERYNHFAYIDQKGTIVFGYISIPQSTREIIDIHFYHDRKLGELGRSVAESKLPDIQLIQSLQRQITKEQHDLFFESLRLGMSNQDIMTRMIARAIVTLQRL